jgi:hypothetical protein
MDDLYAVFSYKNSINLGDEIQSIAAYRLLKQLGKNITFIDRDTHEINDKKYGNYIVSNNISDNTHNKIKLIYNGWFDGNYMQLCNFTNNLLISMHINEQPKDKSYNCLEKHKISFKSLVDSTCLDFYKDKRVGCRDIHTYKKIKGAFAGVDAYISGCATTTLGHYFARVDDNFIVTKKSPVEFRHGFYCVDVNIDSVMKYLPGSYKNKLQFLTHVYNGPSDNNQKVKFTMARQLLSIYKHAELVITSRLHCALPCLAYGTPVIFYHQAVDPIDVRLVGNIDCIPVLGRDNIDFDNLQNILPPDFELKAENIMKSVLEFSCT